MDVDENEDTVLFSEDDENEVAINLKEMEPSGEPLLGGSRYRNEDSEYKFRQKRKTSRIAFLKILMVTLISLTIVAAILVVIFIPSGGVDKQNKCIGKEGVYKTSAVNADAKVCSTVGRDIFKNGGSTIDAAIATLLCVGIANAHSLGLGGGFFLIYYDKPSKEYVAIDARETAPILSSQDMYVGNESMSEKGPLSIAVPGEVFGYWELHQKYGKLPWKDLFEPSISLCLNGWEMGHGLHKAAKQSEDSIKNSPGLRSWLINPSTGKVYNEGDIIKRPMYVDTLRAVQYGGAAAFYNGTLADKILADLKDAGSIIQKADLQKYLSKNRTPVQLKLNNGNTLHSLPPPSSGPVLEFLMSLFDGFNFKPSDLSNTEKEKSVLTYHKIVESMKFAYAGRAELGDQDFVDVKNLVQNLTSTDFANYIRSLITDDRTHTTSYYGRFGVVPKPIGTGHLSLIGPDGSAVGATSTVNFYFGSKVVGSRTNIIFNNEMDDFSTPNTTNGFGLPASPSNFIKPGKRPMSSMCPVIIVDKNGDVVDISGAAGGSKIISATALVLARVMFFGESLKEATDYYRIHHQWLPDVIDYESGFPQEYLDGLVAKGHKVRENTGRMAVVQPIHIEKDGIHAYGDMRKGGCPDGY